MKTPISSKAFCLILLFVLAIIGVLYRVAERLEHDRYKALPTAYPRANLAERQITKNGRLEYLFTNNPR